MKYLTTCAFLLLSFSSYAGPGSKFLSINSKIFQKLAKHLPQSKTLIQNKDATVIEVENHQVEEVSAIIHKRLNRCGGFMAHKSLEEANELLTNSKMVAVDPTAEYTINQQDIVQSMVDDIREENIRDTILKLTAFETRHYTSKSGIESSHMIKDMWQDLSKHRSDVKVEIFRHKHFPQPSVIMTLEGSEKSDEVIILGGHSDSISDEHMAPGADDNASGIASMTEVIRVVMEAGFKPKRTIKFMAYAAEEVGLFGSQEIARNFKKAQTKVMGVLQLDMTLFKGTEDKDIVLISDYTNKEQNKFLGTLIDQYVKVPWGYSACGYGCSDHASWSAYGYPSSFPFESKFEDSSPLIHTNADVLENYGGDASHSVKFSKLAAAFVIEMAN